MVREQQAVRDFLDGVNLGALGLIAAVTLELARVSIPDAPTLVTAMAAFLVLMRIPLAAPALVLIGAALGLIGLR